MDSVLSSNANEQVVGKNGQGSPENPDKEHDGDFDESHQRLLFGGTSAPAGDAQNESTIAAVPKPGQPVSRARESTDDLNLVAISGITANGKADVKPITPTYEVSPSNPLPALAKTGVATTVSLQTPTTDNAVPSGRRSGATDKIAVQLTEDATPKPMISQEIRLDQLDKDTKHRVVAASVNSLFERLGQPVPTGQGDDNARPIVSPATASRKANGTGDAQVFSSNSPATIASGQAEARLPINQPVSSTKAALDSLIPAKPAVEVKEINAPASRITTDVRATGNVIQSPLSEPISTTAGARVKSIAEPTGDNGPVLPRVIGRQIVENTGTQLPPGTIAGDLVGVNRAATSNRALIPDQPLTAPKYPTPVETSIARAKSIDTYAGVPTPAVPDLTGQRLAGTTTPEKLIGDNRLPVVKPTGVINETGVLPTVISGKDGAVIVPSPAGERDVRRNVLNILPAVTEQVAVQLAPQVKAGLRTNADGTPVKVEGPLPTPVPGPSNKIEAPQTAQPATRVDIPLPGVEIKVVGSTVTITGPKSEVQPILQNPATAKPEVTGRVQDGIKPASPLETVNQTVGTTAARVILQNAEQVLQPNNSLPRTEIPANVVRNGDQINPPSAPGARHGELPTGVKTPDGTVVDRTGKPIEPGATTDRTGAKISDNPNATPGTTNGAIQGTIPGADRGLPTDKSLPRATDPTIATDKGIPKAVDGRPGDVARSGEQTVPGVRSGEQAVPGARNGEQAVPGARNGEQTAPGARNGEQTAPGARNGEQTTPGARSSESIRTADGTVKTSSEAMARKDDSAFKTADAMPKAVESGMKSGESNTRVVESTSKVSESGSKVVADVQVKANGEAVATNKPIELAGKVASEIASAQKVQDGQIKSADVVLKGTDVAGRSIEANIKAQDLIANNGQPIVNDKNVRLSDVIVRAAEQAIIKGAEINQTAKLDSNIRVSEQNVQNSHLAQNLQNLQNIQNVQNVNPVIANQQQNKNDVVRNDANAPKATDQNQIVQNQLGLQNQIAQNNIGQIGKSNEQVVGHNVKATPDCPVPGQRNIDAKVDQVVADILNHVRNNSNVRSDLHAGAKALNSLDQPNNAGNQQIDPRVLLDAAAVRRILDGQGITLSPTALNTIMEGIQPTGDHAADYALPSIGSLNLSQIISLGERLQEAVAGAGSETSEPQPKPQLQQHRTKYLVKEGDTLESIAQEKLGDARLVQLLITINRALVNYRLEDEKKVAYVVPNQYMWLPTDHELDVHKKNFFGKHGKDGSIAIAINSKQNTPIIPPVSFDHTKEVSAEVSASMQDFRPASSPSNPLSGNRMSAGYEVKKVVPKAGSEGGSSSGSISGSNRGFNSVSTNGSNSGPISQSGGAKMAGNLDRLRHAGDRKSINLDEIEYASTQVSHRQCYQVREGESLMSIAASLESMGHISMWKLLAKINGFQFEEGGLGKAIDLHVGQFIVLPTTEELNEYKLLEKLTSTSKSAASNAGAIENAFICVQQQKQVPTPPPPALVALAQGVGGLTTVQKLSNYTRLVFNDLPQLENCFSITVEARWNGQWKPMAAYECRHGQTTRHLYNKNGEVKSMDLDLPPYVVKEMAREDFARNWNAYVNIFMGNVASV